MFSRLYGAVVNCRNRLYKKGWLESSSLGAKTVSIGNITVGGTGKTPMVALVADYLADAGEKVCILTRGYGRENARARILVSDGEKILANPKQAGDEPYELAGKLLGKAIVVADANRSAAGNWAREKFGITAFVLDDAFQHLRVERDLNIVLVDATNPFGNGKMLPTGILREPLENLNRADAIIVTRANLSNDVPNLAAQISKYNSHCPIFISENKISSLTALQDFQKNSRKSGQKIQQLPISEKCFAFCALGNPHNFFEQLRRENFALAHTKSFADHHFYTPQDIEKLSAEAARSGAKYLLTTAKDAVKLKDLKIEMPCLVVESEMRFDVENDFRQWLKKNLSLI